MSEYAGFCLFFEKIPVKCSKISILWEEYKKRAYDGEKTAAIRLFRDGNGQNFFGSLKKKT